jgi:hypothetical protein
VGEDYEEHTHKRVLPQRHPHCLHTASQKTLPTIEFRVIQRKLVLEHCLRSYGSAIGTTCPQQPPF